MTKLWRHRSYCLAVLLTIPTWLAAKTTVYSPIVEYGRTEVAISSEHSLFDQHEKKKLATYLEISKAPKPNWTTELVIELEKTGDESVEASAIEWENRFQLTEQGEYFVDVGFFTELEYALEDDEPSEVGGGLILQRDWGRFTGTANLLVAKEVGSNAEDELELALSSKLAYRMPYHMETYVEYQGNEYVELAGPGMRGRISLGHSKLDYDAAILFGFGDEDSPDKLIRFQIEYEF